MSAFRQNYVFIQAGILLALALMLGYMTKVVADASGTQRQLAEQIKRLADIQAPTISDRTQTAAQEVLKDTGLTPEQSKDFAEVLARDLGKQMASDPSGEVKRKLDEWKDAVASDAPPATIAEKTAAVQPLLDRAAKVAADALGLPLATAQKAVATITSLASKTVAIAASRIVELLVEDAYGFMRSLIDKDEPATVCNCCACRANEGDQDEEQSEGGGGGTDDDEPRPDDVSPARSSVVVHFSPDQYLLSGETQREQIWRARMMYRQLTTPGKKVRLRAYTDSTGSDKWNRDLRLRREQSVRGALTDPKFGGFDVREIETLTASLASPPVEVIGKESIPSNRVVVIEIY